jgi:hypothetical protein
VLNAKTATHACTIASHRRPSIRGGTGLFLGFSVSRPRAFGDGLSGRAHMVRARRPLQLREVGMPGLGRVEDRGRASRLRTGRGASERGGTRVRAPKGEAGMFERDVALAALRARRPPALPGSISTAFRNNHGCVRSGPVRNFTRSALASLGGSTRSNGGGRRAAPLILLSRRRRVAPADRLALQACAVASQCTEVGHPRDEPLGHGVPARARPGSARLPCARIAA